MSSTYAGNSANNPASITIPSDGDGPIQASDVVPAFQGVMDLIRRIGAVMFPGALKCVDITANGNWTVPANVTLALGFGCGGGAGGGGGGAGTLSIDEYLPGGGGGGGAELGLVVLTGLTPGAVHAATIGVGGAGGAAGASGTNGSDTTLGTLLTFQGAGAGKGTSALKANASGVIVQCHGGLASRLRVATRNLLPSAPGFSKWDTGSLPAGITALQLGLQQHAEGGSGCTRNFIGEPGASAVSGYTGGAAGSSGSNSGSYQGGGPGGGGGAGPFGVGGGAGSGGNASAGVAVAGTAGTAAASNSGGGGGGGGAGGAGGSTPGAGGAGGAGGSGRIIIFYTDGS